MSLAKMAAMRTKQVLLVDDEPDIARVVRVILEREGMVCHWCATGEEAIDRLAEGGIDLVILDVLLPGVDGHEVCRRIRADRRTESLPVILLTSLTEETDMVVGLELGADDYIRKPFSGRELVARARAAMRRPRGASAAPTEKRSVQVGALEIDYERHSVRAAGRVVQLTLAEWRLLSYLISNRGRAFTRQELLPHVVGEGIFVIDRNIDVHIRNVRKKIGPCARYLQTVRGVGYRFDAGD